MSLEQHKHTHSHIKNHAKFDILHENKYVLTLDRMVLFISVLGPLFTIPQAWQIWSTKDAQGLNTFTWSAWLIFSIFWLIYGIAHKDKPIMTNNFLWILIHSSVILGIFLYR